MRLYGAIQTKFWTHPEVINLSDQAKLLASYLLSSSHTNMLGCFRIPIGYISIDLRWDVETTTKALNDLTSIQFLTYDTSNNWVFINHFLKYQPIENPNQGRNIVKLFNEVPKNFKCISELANQLLQQTKHLDERFCNRLKTLTKPFQNQEQEQYQEQKQEQEDMSGKPDTDLFDNVLSFDTSNSSNLRSQALEVLNFLNEKTKRAYRPVDDNLRLIMARLKTGATVMDCRQIIAKKTREWKGNIKMAEYLRPETLFNSIKFEQYIGELVEPEEAEQHGAS